MNKNELSDETFKDYYQEWLCDEDFFEQREKDLNSMPYEVQTNMKLEKPPTGMESILVKKYGEWTGKTRQVNNRNAKSSKKVLFNSILNWFTLEWRTLLPIGLALVFIIPVASHLLIRGENTSEVSSVPTRSFEIRTPDTEAWVKTIQALKAEGKLSAAKEEQKKYESYMRSSYKTWLKLISQLEADGLIDRAKVEREELMISFPDKDK